MVPVYLKVGDTAWFHGDYTHRYKIKWFPWPKVIEVKKERNILGMTSGKVIAVIGSGVSTLYVIEIETHIDPVHIVRDVFTVSDSAAKRTGFWRRK